jgi:hypothetical protein
MRRRWGFRGWAMVWAVLQLALPAAASMADARLERDALGARAHAEAATTAACRPTHDAACALCQSLSRPQTPAAAAPGCPVALVVRSPLRADAPHAVAAVLLRLQPARAPPVA